MVGAVEIVCSGSVNARRCPAIGVVHQDIDSRRSPYNFGDKCRDRVGVILVELQSDMSFPWQGDGEVGRLKAQGIVAW